MKNKNFVLGLVCLIFTSFVYSQTNYESGYIIKNNDQKVNCLIKNSNWKNNPTEVYYKLTETSPEELGTLDNIKEFGVIDKSRFESHLVNIDKSRSQSNNLTKYEEPRFVQEKIFLRVLVAGKANLYSYGESNLKRYFYSVDGSEVSQLVYKKYLIDTNGSNSVGVNKSYLKQLFDDVKCESIKYTDLKKVDYTRNSLEKYFVKYNDCNNSSSIVEEKKKLEWNFGPKLGVTFNSFNLKNSENVDRSIDFGSATNIKFGFEVEAVLPFNNNKWSVFLDPAYQSYTAEKENYVRFSSTFGRTYDNEVNYKYIELPFGIRHYFFLGENSKIFLDAAVIFNMDINSELVLYKTETDQDILDFAPKTSFGFGIGYKLNDTYSIQAKYYTSPQVDDYVYLSGKYNAFSVTLGYTLF